MGKSIAIAGKGGYWKNYLNRPDPALDVGTGYETNSCG